MNKINVTKPFLPPIEEYQKEIEEIWQTNWLTNNGPLHKQFEKKVGKYLKVDNAKLFVNGHSALEIAIKFFELEGEVITTPFTFASTTHAIVNNNLTPVFCDIELDTYNIDPEKIEELITDKTSAIIPVHVFGTPCNVEAIREIADKYDLKVIYDAAHAFGVEVNDEPIGNFGDISMFSLHATKVFNSIEGGILTYSQSDFSKKLTALKNFGITGKESVEFQGLNAKMNEFQAAMGLVNLRYIEEEIEKRCKVTHKYRKLLENLRGIKLLDEIDNVKHNYSYFPILVEDEFKLNRDELYHHLEEKNIFTRKYFYPLCSEFDCYKGRFESENIPRAKYVADRILALPLYGDLSDDDISRICTAITNL